MRAFFCLHLLFLIFALLAAMTTSAEQPNKGEARPPRSQSEPRVKVLDVRRTTGPWAWIQKSANGGYTVLDQSDPRRFKELSAAINGTFSVSPEGYDALDAYAPNRTGILLVSLEEMAKREGVSTEALRSVETAQGYRFNTVTFELPRLPSPNPWRKSKGEETNFDEYILALITNRDELERNLASADMKERLLAVSLFRRIRSPIADANLLRGVVDDDQSIRSVALAELRNRGVNPIPALRSAAASQASGSVELKELVLVLEYEAAVALATPKAYSDFLKRYPLSRFETEMRYRQLQSIGDHAGLRRLTADFAEKGEVQDIVDALRAGWIEVSFSGGGIQAVHARIRRKVTHPITVRVPASSYFVAGNLASQNMVTTKNLTVQLVSEDWQAISVAAACADMPKNVPDGRETFTVERVPPHSELPKLIALLDKADVGFSTRQAAIWIVTNDASFAELGKLISKSWQTGATSRAIQEDDVAQAMKIAESAGIDLAGRAIWRDRATVLPGVKNPKLQKWLNAHP